MKKARRLNRETIVMGFRILALKRMVTLGRGWKSKAKEYVSRNWGIKWHISCVQDLRSNLITIDSIDPRAIVAGEENQIKSPVSCFDQTRTRR